MITILLPIYNGINFIEECINSIKSQTYDNWQLLIGINGHPKNSEVFMKANKFSSEKIKVFDYYFINNKVDALLELNKNTKSDYICLIDVDDKWLPNKLEKQIRFIYKFDIIGTKCEYFGDIENHVPVIPIGNLCNFNFFKFNPIINSSVMLRKDLLLYNVNNEINNIDKYILEDYSLWLKLYTKKYKFYNVNDILVKHRIHKCSFYNYSNEQDKKILIIKKYYFEKINCK